MIRLLILCLYLCASIVEAKVRVLELNVAELPSAPRWQYGEGAIEKLTQPTRDLAQVKSYYLSGQFEKCLQKIAQLESRVKSLRPWLASQALMCSRQGLAKKTIGAQDLINWVNLVDKNKDWWVIGGQREHLALELVLSRTALFYWYTENDRARAWPEFDKLMELQSYLNQDQLADILKKAGELAFLQQKPEVAYEYFNRSLRLKSNNELNIKINSLRDLLVEKKLIVSKDITDRKVVKTELEASESENQMFEQMKVALAAGDLIPAVQDGVRILVDFPSGERAQEVQKRLLQIYLNVIDKKDPKYVALQKKIFEDLKKIDWGLLIKWGKYLFSKGYHDHASMFFSVAVNKMQSADMLSETYFLWAQSLIYTARYKEATSLFEKSIQVGAGTEFSEKSLFFLGLNYFQLGQFSESAAQFEKLLASRPNSNFVVSSYYWLWRCLQTLDEKRSLEIGHQLFKKYPLTYYGLRARFEIEGGGLDWLKKEDTKKQILHLHLTDYESKAWEIANLLIRSGWFEEAQMELKLLPTMYLTKSKLLMAHLWSWSFDHFRAITTFNQVWDEDPSLLTLGNLSVAFPREFKVYVEKYAKSNGLESHVIWALIRQESSFRKDAKSRAGALGLMQLMPPTAREVSQRFQKSPLNIPDDVVDPETNIRFGSSYLSQLLRAFEGHLPLALAAYNVGIGNMRKWMRLRESLNQQMVGQTSNFRSEIWIDELPWSETSYYVKAVMRNLILYRMLEANKLELRDPIW